jgi:hypothetical protein
MASTVIDQGRRGLRSWQAGLALALLGAALLVVGLVQTTSSSQAQGCPAGTTLVAKFNFQGGSYVFEKGNQGVVSVSGDATGGSFQSSVPISAIIIKGGNDSVLITFSPAQTSGSFSNSGLPPVGQDNPNTPDISNIQFCTPTTPPPTTTSIAPSTTSTSVAPTTSTSTTTTEVGNLPPTPTTTTSTVPVIGPPSTPPGGVVTSVAVLPPPDSPTLPVTGTTSTPLIVLGLLALGAGVTLIVIGRARERRLND